MLSVKEKLLVARIMNRVIHAIRSLAGQGMRTRCRRKGILWDLDLDEGIDLSIFLLGAYEPSVLRAYRKILSPGNVVFDIGANIGAHTLHFAQLVGPTGRVYAFEPTDYAAAKIRENLALNPELARRVNFNQSFLVANGGEALPASVHSRWPVARKHDDLDVDHLGKPETLTRALAVTADEFCDSVRLTQLDLVKIDVDGHEFPVLRGFHRNLQLFRPLILIEVAPFVYRGDLASEFDLFVNYVASLDYIFTEARTGKQIASDPAELRRRIVPGGAMNCVLYPRPNS